MQTSMAITALFMGLVGGPHCVAMCGAACAGTGRAAGARSTQALLSGDGRPGKAGKRICDIAYAWGFVSEAHYSRAFRQHYGITPREARGGLTAPQPLQGGTASEMVGDKEYERWLVENLRL